VALAEAKSAGWRLTLVPALVIGVSAGFLPLFLRPPFAWFAIASLIALPFLWHGFARPRDWPLLFCAATILLPPLPFPIGDSGIHPSIAFAAVGLLAGLARVPEWRVELSALNASLLGLVAAMTISLGFAVFYSGAAIAAASFARVMLFAAGIYVYFIASQGPSRQSAREAERTAAWLFSIAILAALFGCIDFVYQLPAPAGFGAQFIWLDSGVYRRAQGLFYDASALGNFCAFFLVMSVVALVNRSPRILSRPAAGFGSVLFLAALLLSFSRAAMGAAMLSMFALAVLERKRWAKGKVVAAVAALGVATIVGFAVALPEVAYTYWARIGVGWDTLFANPDRVLSGRLDHWNSIAAFIVGHPGQTLAGIGYKTLPYTEYLGKPVIADNMYLSALVETGVLGLATLIALNFAILWTSYRKARQGSFFGTWMFCFWIGEVFQMFAGDVLTFWRVLPVYFWVLAQVVTA
jgi:O-antigen ligase